jgi:[ribosomal protein S5]-alanine N-acetyltransferase
VIANISTTRLDLVPMVPSFMRAALDGRFAEASVIAGIAVPDTWPVHETPLAIRLSQLEADSSLQPWLLRAITLRSSSEMVGYIGFHTAPGPEYLEEWHPGAVEFGFTIFPPYRGKGYAHEASAALMQWAQESHGVRRFVLTISPANHPSQAIAAKLGFVRIGEHMDEVDGVEDVLAHTAVPPNNCMQRSGSP